MVVSKSLKMKKPLAGLLFMMACLLVALFVPGLGMRAKAAGELEITITSYLNDSSSVTVNAEHPCAVYNSRNLMLKDEIGLDTQYAFYDASTDTLTLHKINLGMITVKNGNVKILVDSTSSTTNMYVRGIRVENGVLQLIDAGHSYDELNIAMQERFGIWASGDVYVQTKLKITGDKTSDVTGVYSGDCVYVAGANAGLTAKLSTTGTGCSAYGVYAKKGFYYSGKGNIKITCAAENNVAVNGNNNAAGIIVSNGNIYLKGTGEVVLDSSRGSVQNGSLALSCSGTLEAEGMKSCTFYYRKGTYNQAAYTIGGNSGKPTLTKLTEKKVDGKIGICTFVNPKMEMRFLRFYNKAGNKYGEVLVDTQDDKNYHVLNKDVNGTKEGSHSSSGSSSNYNAAFDPATATLTLNNFDGGRISADTCAPLFIQVNGTNYVEGLEGDSAIVLMGNGTLNVKTYGSGTPQRGIKVDKLYVLGSVKLNVELPIGTPSGNGTDGIYADGVFLFNDEKVNVSVKNCRSAMNVDHLVMEHCPQLNLTACNDESSAEIFGTIGTNKNYLENAPEGYTTLYTVKGDSGSTNRASIRPGTGYQLNVHGASITYDAWYWTGTKYIAGSSMYLNGDAVGGKHLAGWYDAAGTSVTEGLTKVLYNDYNWIYEMPAHDQELFANMTPLSGDISWSYDAASSIDTGTLTYTGLSSGKQFDAYLINISDFNNVNLGNAVWHGKLTCNGSARTITLEAGQVPSGTYRLVIPHEDANGKTYGITNEIKVKWASGVVHFAGIKAPIEGQKANTFTVEMFQGKKVTISGVTLTTDPTACVMEDAYRVPTLTELLEMFGTSFRRTKLYGYYSYEWSTKAGYTVSDEMYSGTFVKDDQYVLFIPLLPTEAGAFENVKDVTNLIITFADMPKGSYTLLESAGTSAIAEPIKSGTLKGKYLAVVPVIFTAKTGTEIPARSFLTYNAAEQTFATTSDYYVVTNGTGKNVGSYYTNYTLKSGYIWENGTYADRMVAHEITPCSVTIKPYAKTKKYGEADPNFSTYGSAYTAANISGTLLADYKQNVTGSLAREPGENAGTYAINLGSLAAGDNYSLVLDETVVYLTIQKAESVLTIEPQGIEGLVYQGEALQLITPGSAEGGVLLYSLTGKGVDYLEEIPVANAAGTYTVYYKIVGDENHKDSAAKTITVEVQEALVTISYDANGGSGNMDAVSMEKGSAYELPVCGFTAPAGKTFDGWDVNDAMMQPGQSITVTKDVTVKAMWKDAEENAIVITKQPKSVEVAKAGETATISVEATGNSLSYTWYYKDAGAAGYTKSNIKTASVSLKVNAAKDGRQMYCVVTDGSGENVTSDVVTVSIRKNAELAITKQPKSVEVAKAGETATISVEATGNSLSYTWYYKDAGAAGYTKSNIKTASVSLKVNAAKDGRQMYCVVTDGSGESVTSDVVTVSIRKNAELAITKQPKSVEVAKAGETATISVEATGNSLSYTWYYKDAGAADYTKSNIKTASVSLKVNAAKDGRQLYCVVTDGSGKSVTSDIVKVSIKKNSELAITKQPKSVEVAKAGGTATISVEATGNSLSYTWYYKDAGATDYTKSNIKTASVSLKVNAAKDGRQLYCVVTDGSGKSVTSDIVAVSIKK